jgi:hypothetical protein
VASTASGIQTGQGSASCPNCGAPITFASPALPVKVCASCQSLIVRHDAGLERVGEAAMLPFDVSPVQIGTEGRFEGQGFRIIGRVRWGWSAGSWNEWLCLFDDGSHRWLGEAMGDFMLTSEYPMTDESGGVLVEDRLLVEYAAGRKPELGAVVVEGGVHYVVTDIKQAHAIACEGDLPFAVNSDWVIDSIDFRSDSGQIASFQRDHELSTFYTGRVVSLSDLAATNLRVIDGWTMPDFSVGAAA